MINLYESMGLGWIKLVTPGSVARHVTDCAMRPYLRSLCLLYLNIYFVIFLFLYMLRLIWGFAGRTYLCWKSHVLAHLWNIYIRPMALSAFSQEPSFKRVYTPMTIGYVRFIEFIWLQWKPDTIWYICTHVILMLEWLHISGFAQTWKALEYRGLS